MQTFINTLLGWAGLSDSAGTNVGRYRLTYTGPGPIDVMSKVSGFFATAMWLASMFVGLVAVQMLGWIVDPEWLVWLSNQYRAVTETAFNAVPPVVVAGIIVTILMIVLLFKPTVTSSAKLTEEDRNRITAAVVLFAAVTILSSNPFLILDLTFTFTADLIAMMVDTVFGGGTSTKSPLVDSILRFNTTLISYGTSLTGECAKSWSQWVGGKGSEPSCAKAVDPNVGMVFVAFMVMTASWTWIAFAAVCLWKFLKHLTIGTLGLVALPWYCALTILKRRPLEGVGALLGRSLGHIVVAVIVQGMTLLWTMGVAAFITKMKTPGILAVVFTAVGYLIGTGVVVWLTRKKGALITTMRATSDGMPITGRVSEKVHERVHRTDAYQKYQNVSGRMTRRTQKGRGMSEHDSSVPPPMFRTFKTKQLNVGKLIRGSAIRSIPARGRALYSNLIPVLSNRVFNTQLASTALGSVQQVRGVPTDLLQDSVQRSTWLSPETADAGGKKGNALPDGGKHAAPPVTEDALLRAAEMVSPYVVLPNGALFDILVDGPPTMQNVTVVMDRWERESPRPMYGGQTPRAVLAEAGVGATNAVAARVAEFTEALTRVQQEPVPVHGDGSAAERAQSLRGSRSTERNPATSTESRTALGESSLSSVSRQGSGRGTPFVGTDPADPGAVSLSEEQGRFIAIRHTRLRGPLDNRPVNRTRGGSATRGDVRLTQSDVYALKAAEANRDRKATMARLHARGQAHHIDTGGGDPRTRIIPTPDRPGGTVTPANGVGFGDRVR